MKSLGCNITVFVEVAEGAQVSPEICNMSQPNFISLFKLLVYISSFPNFLVSQRGLSTAFGSRNVSIYPIYQFLKRKGITCLDLQPLFLLLQSIKWILQTFKVSILIEMCKSNADQIHLSKIQNLVSPPTSKPIKVLHETSHSFRGKTFQVIHHNHEIRPYCPKIS